METNDNDMNMKVSLYFKKGIKSHIILHSGQWYNGLITEFCEEGWFMFQDRKIEQAFPIYVSDVKEITPFMENLK